MQCFHSQVGLCWRVHGYSTELHWQNSLQGTRQKWTDLSHHAQLSMCTSRDKMDASGMEFSDLIECEFVAVVSWKVGWLCFFYTKFALVRSDDWWVSFTCPWAGFYLSRTTGRVVSSNTVLCSIVCYIQPRYTVKLWGVYCENFGENWLIMAPHCIKIL